MLGSCIKADVRLPPALVCCTEINRKDLKYRTVTERRVSGAGTGREVWNVLQMLLISCSRKRSNFPQRLISELRPQINTYKTPQSHRAVTQEPFYFPVSVCGVNNRVMNTVINTLKS